MDEDQQIRDAFFAFFWTMEIIPAQPQPVLWGSFLNFYRPFWGQEGFENDPEPYGSLLFSDELIPSHMDPFQAKQSGFVGNIFFGFTGFWVLDFS